MIALAAILVLIGTVFAMPVFAIPSPDFIGPLITWLVTMIGLASTFFGAIMIYLRRAVSVVAKKERSRVFAIVIGAFFVTLVLLGLTALYRYEASRQSFDREIAERKQSLETDSQAGSVITPTTTEKTLPATTPSLPTDLISSRVASSTRLVPTAILRQVIQESQWADRILLVDIREPEEREVGFIPATTTLMRYGDLITGGAATLPHDRDILVTCWTSIRGEEITAWLRAHGFPRAFAIAGGLQGDRDGKYKGWIADGLPWQGETKWSVVFGVSNALTVAEAKKKYDAGEIVIDVRPARSFATAHVKGAVWLDLESFSAGQVSSTFALIPKTKTVFTYCDGYVNCFYAKILSVRMKRLGWTVDDPFADGNHVWFAKGYPSE